VGQLRGLPAFAVKHEQIAELVGVEISATRRPILSSAR